MANAYKQWPGMLREARYVQYKQARAAGILGAPGPCEICGETRNTVHHAEDYGPTLQDYFAALHSLCSHCHKLLHLRFRFPERWEFHVRSCRLGPLLETARAEHWWEVLSTSR